jgi:subtilisin family serine protease
MSLGSPRDPGEGFSPAYEAVAQALLNQGIIIAAAAGNESDRPEFPAAVGNPAACPSILSVAAIDRWRQVADFSCRQMDNIGEVNVSAPGVSVYSTWRGQQYIRLDGTSMATPHVAGVAALLLEKNPQFSGQDLWQALQTTATVLGASADFGSGLVQAPTV